MKPITIILIVVFCIIIIGGGLAFKFLYLDPLNEEIADDSGMSSQRKPKPVQPILPPPTIEEDDSTDSSQQDTENLQSDGDKKSTTNKPSSQNQLSRNNNNQSKDDQTQTSSNDYGKTKSVSLPTSFPLKASEMPDPIRVVGHYSSTPWTIQISPRTYLIEDVIQIVDSWHQNGFTAYWHKVEPLMKFDENEQIIQPRYHIFVGAFATYAEGNITKRQLITSGLLNTDAELKRHEYTTTIGEFTSQENADKAYQYLQKKGYPVYINESDSGQYRVMVGAYETLSQAETMVKILSSDHFNSVVVNR